MSRLGFRLTSYLRRRPELERRTRRRVNGRAMILLWGVMALSPRRTPRSSIDSSIDRAAGSLLMRALDMALSDLPDTIG
jgi:hypothetical protein